MGRFQTLNLRIVTPMIAAGSMVAMGCPSLSTLQTVDTVPTGETRFAVGAEAVGASGGGTSGAAPQIEFGIRHGLTDNLDIGGKIYVAGLELGVKYQYLTGSFDGAIAPAISGMYFGTSEGSGGFLYIHLPFLFDVDVSDTFSFAFGPKFLYAVVFGDVTEGEDDIDFSSDGLLGGLYLGFPFRLGDAFWLVPEINLYTGLATEGDAFDVLLWQGGIGLLFGGGPADEPVAAP